MVSATSIRRARHRQLNVYDGCSSETRVRSCLLGHFYQNDSPELCRSLALALSASPTYPPQSTAPRGKDMSQSDTSLRRALKLWPYVLIAISAFGLLYRAMYWR